MLGPLLFSLFINDLPTVVNNSICNLYADDVQLQISGQITNGPNLIENINKDLERIHIWAVYNELKLNPSKSVYIIVSRRIVDDSCWPKIKLSGMDIKRSTEVKNLGVWFDERLSWWKHVSHVCEQVYGSLRRLWLIAWALPFTTKLHLVRTLIVPIFSYCSTVYCSLTTDIMKFLQAAFNACTRFVLGIRKYDRLGRNRNIILNCTLKQHFERSICFTIFKLITCKEPSYLYNRLKPSMSLRTLKLNPARRRLSSFDGMFFIKGITIWNNLPQGMRRISSLTEFKKCYKMYSIN